MFQVASPLHHFSDFSLHGHGHHTLSPISAPSVQLPRTLSRPQFSEVSRDSISAVAPELTNVPAEYIRRGLRAKAPQYVFVFAITPFQFSMNTFFVECSQESLLCPLHICRFPSPNHKYPQLSRFQFAAPHPTTRPIYWPSPPPNPLPMNTPASFPSTALSSHPNAPAFLDYPLQRAYQVVASTYPSFLSICLLRPPSKFSTRTYTITALKDS